MKILDKTFMPTTHLFPILVSAITILFTCSSCEKNQAFKNEEEIKLNDTYLCPPLPQGQIKIIGYAPRAKPFLGAGYDVMGDFLNNSSVKESVLDLNKISEDDITHIKALASFANGYEGKEVTEFLTSIQEKTDIVPPAGNAKELLFTGTIDSYDHFTDPYDYSSQYSFVCEDVTWTEEIMRIHAIRIKDLISYLSDQFKNDLTLLSPESLIEKYGTHVLKTVHLGSRTRTLYRSVVANDDKKYALTANYGLTARQKQIYKKPNITTYEPEEEVARNHGGTIFVECLGGDPSTIPFLALTPNEVIGDPMDLTPWKKSLNSSNLALSELKADHLLPICELIVDPAKKEQVRQAIGDYIHSRQLKVRKTAPLFQAFNKMYHKYCISYNDYLKLSDKSWTCSAPLGSIDLQQQPQTVPLYLYSNSMNDRFTLNQKEIEGMEYQRIAGYVYSNYQNGLLTVFEIWNGLDYAYTTEDKEVYGENKSWKKTGMAFYIKKIS